MARCVSCLRGAKISITGTNKRTLRMDMGGAVLYLMPDSKGMEVTLNTEDLVDGDFASAAWDGERWVYATGKAKNMG